jgi:hypothetical protein
MTLKVLMSVLKEHCAVDDVSSGPLNQDVTLQSKLYVILTVQETEACLCLHNHVFSYEFRILF